MKRPGDYLAAGFGLAFGRPHLILLDVVAKGLRWGIVVFLLMLAVGATLARIPASEAQILLIRSGVPDLEALALDASLAANAGLLLVHLIAAGLAGAVASVLIEGVTRGIIVGLDRTPATEPGASGRPPGRFDPGARGTVAIRSVLRHLASGLTRRLVFGALAIILALWLVGPVLTGEAGQWTWTGTELRWPIIAGVILVGLVAFSLTILDTLARLGALELMGTSLPEVVAVSAFPIMIELTVWTASLAVLAVLAGRAGPGPHPLLVAGLILAATTVSSAMLLVRYGSIGLMHKDLQPSE
jgi:hypothetical protein